MNNKCLTPEEEKSPLPPLFQRGVLKSPFGKGGFEVFHGKKNLEL